MHCLFLCIVQECDGTVVYEALTAIGDEAAA
jgi:hypothetical protein